MSTDRQKHLYWSDLFLQRLNMESVYRKQGMGILVCEIQLKESNQYFQNLDTDILVFPNYLLKKSLSISLKHETDFLEFTNQLKESIPPTTTTIHLFGSHLTTPDPNLLGLYLPPPPPAHTTTTHNLFAYSA